MWQSDTRELTEGKNTNVLCNVHYIHEVQKFIKAVLSGELESVKVDWLGLIAFPELKPLGKEKLLE